MTKSILFCLMATAILLSTPAADAQQAGKILRIGYLDSSTASGSKVLVEAFRQELSKLGWIEERILPPNTGFTIISLSANLNLRQTWFVLRLI